jgi:negative regulator of flagellin synthesis FlgM
MDAFRFLDLSNQARCRYGNEAAASARKESWMINGIGKAGAGRLELVRGSAERGASVEKAGGSAAQREISGPLSMAAEMAAAPINSEKVAAIRAAIAEGRYPVDPAKIAARMIELDLPLFDGQ